MAKRTISASDSAASAVGKINDNFNELFNGVPVGIIGLNDDAIARIAAAKQHYDEDANDAVEWPTDTGADCFVIAHGSDFHTDAARYGRFRDFVDGVSLIDTAIVSGDLTDQGGSSEFSAMAGVEFERVEPLQVIGNHERNGGKTIAQIGEALGQPTIKVNNVDTYTGYYYVDYSTPKIRIIVLNQYDTSATTQSTANKTGHWSQAQIDWLLGALDGAITNGYSVIVAMHAVEQGSATSSNAFPTPNDKGFYQRSNAWENNYSTAMQSHIIEDIIHAFRNKTNVSGTYAHTDGTSSVIINHTFSGNGKFVAYIVGHAHVDMIGYSKYKSDQLYLAAPIGCVWGGQGGTSASHRFFGGEVSDLPRIEGTKSEDCFNVYGIDTVNKLVKVVRIGADMNDLMEKREVACFEYEPSNS